MIPSPILVSYFSAVPNGNTVRLAGIVAQTTGGTMFRITPETPYPTEKHALNLRATTELRNGIRPPLTEPVENMTGYHSIFLGFPVWWGTMPMPVISFLDSYNLTGKYIFPFCVHDGGGYNCSGRDLMFACPTAHIGPHLAINTKNIPDAEILVSTWLKTISSALAD